MRIIYYFALKVELNLKLKGRIYNRSVLVGTVTWWGMASSTFSREVMHHAPVP